MKRIAISVFVCLCSMLALAQDSVFVAEVLPDSVFRRMLRHSYPVDCTVARQELRYLRLSHYDAEGQVHTGELVCNERIAADLLDIFRQLYEARYPIQQMRLIDDYDADDEQSMRSNNTSCFCYRKVRGAARLSKHALGLAVDINPLFNPCVRTGKDGKPSVQPATGIKYAFRNHEFPYKIEKDDLLYRLFIAHGFTWGGSWRTLKDYQHFEK